MSVISTDSNRLSSVVKYEDMPNLGICRDVLTLYSGSAATLKVGAVLGKFVDTPTATSAAGTNTGNGTMGTVTVTSNKQLKVGTYTLKVTKSVANAGDFVVSDKDGVVVGNGSVGTAFNQGGLAFTLADGSTDFVAGDTFTITVAGTEKYKLLDITATDGSEIALAIYIGDQLGNSGDLVVAATSNTPVLAITRGHVIVARDALTYGASVTTGPQKAAVWAQLKTRGIFAEVTI